LLGLEEDVLMTDVTYRGVVLYKAALKRLDNNVDRTYFSSNSSAFNLVTHFDVSHCQSLHCGHLEQLAIACPRLQLLNLSENVNCLLKLEGLSKICTSCRELVGINLKGISLVESHHQLWKILSGVKLVYLAIELVMIQVSETIECSELIALEICHTISSSANMKINLK